MQSDQAIGFDFDLKDLGDFRKQLQAIVEAPDFNPEPWLMLAFNESDPDFHTEHYQWARQYLTEHNVAQLREDHNAYGQLDLYFAKVPIANAIGFEFGCISDRPTPTTVQRSGFGFYIRSDHAFNKSFKLMPPI